MNTTKRLKIALNYLQDLDTKRLNGVDTIMLGRAENILREIIEERKAKKRGSRPVS